MTFPIISCFLEGRSSLYDGTQPPLRTYITKNVDRLAELRRLSRESDDAIKELDEYNKLLAKVQARVAVLNDNNAPIGDDLKTKLNEAGLSLPSAE